MRENIWSNVVLIETNLSRRGKFEINLIKHIQDKWCLNLETFLLLADTSFRFLKKYTQTKFSFRH